MRHVICLILVIFLAAAAWADDPQAEPSTDTPAAAPAEGDQPAADEGMKLPVTVVLVTGAAQHKSVGDETGQWLPLAAGDELSELTVIRTGLGAQVVLRLGDRSEITIRSATKIGIGSLRQGARRKVTTRVGLKYGSIHAKVDPSQGPNDFQIRTPVATLSVRGTGGDVGFSHQGMGVNGTEGTWNNNTSGGDTGVGAGETSDGDGTPSGDLDDEDRDTRNGDPHGGTSDEEENNLNQNGGGRGGFDFNGNGTSDTDLNAPGETTGSGSSGSSGNGDENGENGYKRD
jgi:hypothetical protein